MHALEEESSVPMHHDRPRQEADDEQHRVVAYQIQTSVRDGAELVLGATILSRLGLRKEQYSRDSLYSSADIIVRFTLASRITNND
jgi:hypothetical protein